MTARVRLFVRPRVRAEVVLAAVRSVPFLPLPLIPGEKAVADLAALLMESEYDRAKQERERNGKL